jgi:hypothetical protein
MLSLAAMMTLLGTILHTARPRRSFPATIVPRDDLENQAGPSLRVSDPPA